MWFDSDNAEGIEPPLGLVVAVADDEMIAVKRLVVEIIPVRSMVISLNRVANHNGMVRVADVNSTIAQIIIKPHTECLLAESHHNVRAFHVAVHQCALDVDFVLVVGRVFFCAREHRKG